MFCEFLVSALDIMMFADWTAISELDMQVR